ncbi:MAG: phosphatidate cytidylyltransferase [Bacteroidales bacterium]
MNNTQVRSLSGTLFLIIITGSLLWSPVIFGLVMLFSILIMTKEFLSISFKNSYKTTTFISLVGSFTIYLLFFLYYYNSIDIKFFWLISLPFTGMFISILYEKEKGTNNNNQSFKNSYNENYLKTGFILIAPLYIALPFSLTNTILFDTVGNYMPNILLSMFIILWSSDVGAYLFGITFGQKNGHKLFPSISPKKSWEGFFGGLISALITGIILYYIKIISFSIVHIVALSTIIFIFGVFGDLVESLFKRNFGVKDSGNIMPGHGGLLDRFDSALLAFPMAIAYLKIFELI